MINTLKTTNKFPYKSTARENRNFKVDKTKKSQIPEGYISGDEFFGNVEQKLFRKLKEDGYIQ
jgi:hypothetical protein